MKCHTPYERALVTSSVRERQSVESPSRMQRPVAVCVCVEGSFYRKTKCERFNISLKNHKTNYKLTLLLRWLFRILNLVMCFAVFCPRCECYCMLNGNTMSQRMCRHENRLPQTAKITEKNICMHRVASRRPQNAFAAKKNSITQEEASIERPYFNDWTKCWGFYCNCCDDGRPQF